MKKKLHRSAAPGSDEVIKWSNVDRTVGVISGPH